jgi:hypothetical protein
VAGGHSRSGPEGQSARSGARRDLNLRRPSIARVYDYVLGGRDHFEIDRRAAHSFLNVVPEAGQLAKDNRHFVRRSVRFMVVEAGIKQIIDIGSGLPTAGNAHQVAHEVDPSVRVVYVDHDPMVLAHARATLNDDFTSVITAELRAPESIFDNPETHKLIDVEQPFGVLIAGVLHHLADEEDPAGVADDIKARLSPGSYLAMCGFLDEDPRAKDLERGFLDGVGSGRFRGWDEHRHYFEGLEMVPPGLVYANTWRPDAETPKDHPVERLYVGGVGRKP